MKVREGVDKSSPQRRYNCYLFPTFRFSAEMLKTSDMILMILDATKRAEQRALLEQELEAVGIRLNREPPYVPLSNSFALLIWSRNIYLKTKKAGGMKITFQSPPKSIDEKMVHNILKDYKMLNCEVLIRDENGKSIDPRI